MKTLGEINRQAFRAAMDQEADLMKGYQAGAEAVKAEVIERIKRELDNLAIQTFENYDAEAVSAYECSEVIDILNALLIKEG